jgi:hypothetical protein
MYDSMFRSFIHAKIDVYMIHLLVTTKWYYGRENDVTT